MQFTQEQLMELVRQTLIEVESVLSDPTMKPCEATGTLEIVELLNRLLAGEDFATANAAVITELLGVKVG